MNINFILKGLNILADTLENLSHKIDQIYRHPPIILVIVIKGENNDTDMHMFSQVPGQDVW